MTKKESNLKRSTVRLKKKKEKIKKRYSKSLILFSGIGIFIVIGLGVLYTIDQKQAEIQIADHTIETLKNNQKKQEQTGITTTEKITEKDKLTQAIYLPTASEELPMKDLEKEMNLLMEKAEKKYKSKRPTVLIGQLASESYTEQLSAYYLSIDTYQWNPKKETFKQLEAINGEATYINQQTNLEITSKDLIGEEANLLGIQQVIQQRLLDEAKEPQKIIDDVLDFPRIDWETTMTYTPEALQITLPENKLAITEITLPYTEIQAFIQTDLVHPDFLSAEKQGLDPNKKYIALTFDDGPIEKTTPKILEILKKKQVKSTFFMLGENAQNYPNLVKSIYDDGHELASHSYSHPQLIGLSKDKIEQEVKKTDKAVFEATGVLPRTFRPPYGAVNPEVADIIGKPIIQWNIDSLDWKSKNKNSIIQLIKQSASEGGILLMHDIQPATAEALETVIDYLLNEGYEFVTTQELLESKPKPLYQYFGQGDQREI